MLSRPIEEIFVRLSVTDMPENFPVQGANGRALSVFARVINLSLDDPAGTQNMVSIDARPVSYTHLTLPTIYSV